MNPLKSSVTKFIFIVVICLALTTQAVPEKSEVDRLVSAMLEDTPVITDLEQLCDEIGGRPTGSKANLEAVEWALKKFEDAGIPAKKESFTMPKSWLKNSAEAEAAISGDVSFTPRVVVMPFSTPTPKAGLKAPLIEVGHGTEEDFTHVGPKAKGAFILVETEVLRGLEGLFNEYTEGAAIEKRAFAAGVAGVVYMSSRPRGLLYRHNASLGEENKHPMLVMVREHAERALRLLRGGKTLFLTAKIDVQSGGEYESFNVIGEIGGSEKPGEIVVVGAHLDSWDLGTGANDNGCNVAVVIDVARQMKRLGIMPKRTIRFALWNGEEQGLVGSWQYTLMHLDEMDGHVMACSLDTGSGRISGFVTCGRGEIIEPLKRALKPVEEMGPFNYINVPQTGTDHYDFMMQGIAAVMFDQEMGDYTLDYHAESDTFDKVDLRQLKKNAAILAAFTYGFANMDVTWKRQTRAEIQKLIDTTPLGKQMEAFGLYPGWLDGSRGRK